MPDEQKVVLVAAIVCASAASLLYAETVRDAAVKGIFNWQPWFYLDKSKGLVRFWLGVGFATGLALALAALAAFCGFVLVGVLSIPDWIS